MSHSFRKSAYTSGKWSRKEVELAERKRRRRVKTLLRTSGVEADLPDLIDEECEEVETHSRKRNDKKRFDPEEFPRLMRK